MVITVGGIGTIVAVLFILVFLIAVVAPLFGGATTEPVGQVAVDEVGASRPLRVRVDDFSVASWELGLDGTIRVRRLDTGDIIEEASAFPAGAVTSLSSPVRENTLALGLKNGGVVLGRIAFETTFREPDAPDVPEALRSLPEGACALWDGGVVQRTPAGQLRRQTLQVDLADPVVVDSTSPVVLVDRTDLHSGPTFAALTEDGVLHVRVVREKPNLMTGEIRRKVRGADVVIERPEGRGLPSRILLSGLADNVFLVWDDGYLLRYGIRDLQAIEKMEARDLLPEAGARVVGLAAVVGKSTFVVADDRSRLRAFFLATSSVGESPDGMVLLLGHEIDLGGVDITTLTASLRSRTVAAGTSTGRVLLYFVTSEKRLADLDTGAGGPVEAIAISPRDDAVLALAGPAWHRWAVKTGHPEATPRSLLSTLHYEGYETPEYVWQTSGATDAAEMKMSLVPLIFGTLKATLFSMLFAVPLALLAALYTSEFLNPRVRPRVKAVVEVMASLPSVVLGFIAAFVLAPFVESVVPTVILAFVTIPFAFVLGANLWQLLPRQVTLGLESRRLGFIAGVVPIGLLLAVLFAPVVESAFFAGDLKGWLDGRVGGAAGGWALALLPVGLLLAALLIGKVLGLRARDLDERQAARFSLGRFLITGVCGLLIAWGLAGLLSSMSLDPRGSLVGTYVQRNAMVVGFAMGFAVIPIIYTLAEDALSSVPQHLRAASLGAGATPWQTAVRIVAPTAASGIFSACMIGLGRAVGETMIVLMAAGNTAIMDWNPFNGFQTLSAAIATEMPEAVRDSTHYRVLFLAGLALFAMTFVVNTAAEMVRLRFRKKAVQL